MSARRSVIMVTPDSRIDRRVMLQAGALRADGWDVRVVAMPLEDSARSDPDWVIRAPRPSASSREGLLMRAHALATRALPMNGPIMRGLKSIAWSQIADPSSFFRRAFEPVLSGLRADVVTAHDLPVLPVGSWLAARCGARLVFDSHELWTEQNFPEAWRRAWSRVERSYIGECDIVMTVNRSIASELALRHGIREVHVVTNAVPVGIDRPRSLRERCGISPVDKVLLYQGSLSAGRQLEHCVDAVAGLRDSRVHLVMLGDGTLRGRLVRHARAARAASRIHVLPAVPQAELLGWTASADAGIVPYVADCLNSRLCTPNKLYEFIAAGLPILASDLPELRAIVAGEGFGVVAPLETSASIARAITDLFADERRLRAWAGAVRAGRGRHSWEAQAEALRRIYSTLCPS